MHVSTKICCGIRTGAFLRAMAYGAVGSNSNAGENGIDAEQGRNAVWEIAVASASQHVDDRMKPQNAAMVEKAVAPDYALGAHTASLGLCWSGHSKLPARFRSGMFVGQHGSWNRRTRSGYKVVFVGLQHGQPQGVPIEILGGFLDGKGDAPGRPVGLAIDKQGCLRVADDVGNTVWRVSADVNQ
jgi:glucose/arabinose dehydrogenase